MSSIQVPNELLLTQVESFLKEGKEVIIRAKGNSMLPFIRGDRDSVALRHCESPEPGDIVLVRLPGRYVMHRIVSVEDGVYTMMGDGNLYGTESFRAEDVLGKVVRIIRDGRKDRLPGKGRLWKALLPLRRYLLWIYRKFAI